MSLSRRRLLSTVPALTVGGCLASEDGDEYPTPTDCPDEPRVPQPEPHPDGAELPPIPDPPESLADEAVVEEYVGAYERAYVWREATTWFDDPIVSVTTGAVPEARESRDAAVIVDLGPVPSGEVDYGNGPAHFDGEGYTASYLVTSDGVWRAKRDGRGSDHPDPAEDGTLLQCF